MNSSTVDGPRLPPSLNRGVYEDARHVESRSKIVAAAIVLDVFSLNPGLSNLKHTDSGARLLSIAGISMHAFV